MNFYPNKIIIRYYYDFNPLPREKEPENKYNIIVCV